MACFSYRLRLYGFAKLWRPKAAPTEGARCAARVNGCRQCRRPQKPEGRRRQRDPQCRSAQEEAEPLNDPKQAHLVAAGSGRVGPCSGAGSGRVGPSRAG